MFNKAEAEGMRRRNAFHKSHCCCGLHLLTLCSVAGRNPWDGALTHETGVGEKSVHQLVGQVHQNFYVLHWDSYWFIDPVRKTLIWGLGFPGFSPDSVICGCLTLNTQLSSSVLSTHLQAKVPAEHNPVAQGISFWKCIYRFCLQNLYKPWPELGQLGSLNYSSTMLT